MLFLYKISQSVHDDYDTYSDAVVAAESEDDAMLMHPDGKSEWQPNPDYGLNELETELDTWINEYGSSMGDHDWANPFSVSVTLIGVADISITKGVICASYHAG